MERNEGLFYPPSVVRRFTMKDYFFFEEQRAIPEKLILTTSDQKKIVETIKKVREKSL